MKDAETKNVETIRMVERALDVLDLLHTGHTKLGVNEIAKQCSQNVSTTFRILKTLEKSGWVFQLEDGRYMTGPKISFVTEKDNLYLALSDVSLCVMTQYTQKYSQPMNLMVRDGVHCTILQQSLTKSLINYVPPLHSYLPFYACGGGKILLSELPSNMVEQIIDSCEMKPLTPYTITDPQQYMRILKETSVQGFALDHKESSPNGSCIAVPVRDKNNTIIASLSFSGFVGVQDTGELLKYLPELKEASQKISEALFRAWGW